MDKLEIVKKDIEQEKYFLLSDKNYTISDIHDIYAKILYLKIFNTSNTYLKNTADYFKSKGFEVIKTDCYYKINYKL